MATRYRTETTECKVYVGDLPRDADEKELHKSFSHYGALKSVWVARNPPGFAFIQFEDPRDAQDAVRALDGSTLCGARVRVEHATGKTKPKSFTRGVGRPVAYGIPDRREIMPYRIRETSPPPRRPYNATAVDRCYICGDFGHASYDCPRSSSGRPAVRGGHYGGSLTGGRDAIRRYDNNVDRDRERERDRDRRRRTPPSPPAWNNKTRTKSRSRSYSRSPARSERRTRSRSKSRD